MKSTVSLEQLLISSLREEGISLSSIKKETRKQNRLSFWQAIKKVKKFWDNKKIERFYDLDNPKNPGDVSLSTYYFSLSGFIAGFSFMSWYSELIIPIVICLSWLLFTWGLHASIIWVKDRLNLGKDQRKAEDIIQTFSSYLEKKREETLSKTIDQEKALEKERELLSSDIKQIKELIDDPNATTEGREALQDHLKPLEEQDRELKAELNQLKEFRSKVHEGIDFLRENLSPKVTWNLRAVETIQRSDHRLEESAKQIEKSKLLREDAVRDFGQLFNMLESKLSTVNQAYRGLLTNDYPILLESEELDVTEITEFINKKKVGVA